MLAFPAAYQEGGWVRFCPSNDALRSTSPKLLQLLGISFTLLFMCITALTSTYLVRVIQHYKDVKRAEDKLRLATSGELGESPRQYYVEYETLVRATRSRALLSLFHLTFICSMIMMAISCICIVARALDNLSITTFGNAYGLQILPTFSIRPSCRAGEDCRARQAFQDTSDVHGYIITQGYFLTMLVAVPFSLMDINDWFQGVSYVISLLCLLEMIAVFSYIAWAPSMASDRALYGGGGTVPAVSYNVGLIIEVCFWSWAIAFAVPMWIDEKAEHVSVSRSLWSACLHRGALDIMLGLSGAAAFPGLSTLSVLDELRVRPDVGTLTELCGILFAITALVPNIVDYQMAVSRNLEAHFGPARAGWLGVGLPYGIAWAFYFGAAFNTLVNSCTVFLNGAVEVALPCILFLFFSLSFKQASLRMVGVSMPVRSWRRVTWGVLALGCALILLAYVLNACVRLGVYGPRRTTNTKHAVEEQDYSAYAANSDLNGTAANAPAPAPAPAAAAALFPPPLPTARR